MRHTVRKQIFDLWVDRNLDAFVLQQRISDRFWMDIIPEMEKLFDEISDADRTIKIDVLEIDLGNITPEMIDTGAWAELFRDALQKKLKAVIDDISIQDADRIEALPDNSFDQWYYFIEKGFLPWNASRPTEAWYAQVLQAIAESFETTQRLRNIILRPSSVVKRIICSHTTKFISHLVELLTAEKQSMLPAYINELADWLSAVLSKQVRIYGDTQKEIELKLWTAVFKKVAVQQPGLDTETIIRYLLTEWLQLNQIALYELSFHQSISKNYGLILPLISGIVNDDLQNKPAHGKQDFPGNKNSTEKKEDGNRGGRNEEILSKPQQHGNEKNEPDLEQFQSGIKEALKKENEYTVADQVTAEDGIYIMHAGLVLLHPFLHNFFKKLDLVKEGLFKDPASQERGICLLHELVDSGMPVYEYDLVLPKLLCGWPSQKAVETSVVFTEIEKEEVQELLMAAIVQWEKLKNTSPSVLQETFLKREGKLFYQNEKWYLQVEKKPVDVLLNYLPWMISMIKLPWMKELLRVEWI